MVSSLTELQVQLENSGLKVQDIWRKPWVLKVRIATAEGKSKEEAGGQVMAKGISCQS